MALSKDYFVSTEAEELSFERGVALEGIEQEDALSDAAVALEQVQVVEDDLRRLEDLAQSLEDLAYTAQHLTVSEEGFSKTDSALLHTAVDMAMAGVDGGAEDALPSFEELSEASDNEIAMEGIRKIAKSVYEAIMRALDLLWTKLTEFWRNMTSAIPGLRAAAGALQERAEAAVGKTSEETTVDLGKKAFALEINGELPKDIASELDKSKNLAVAFFGRYTKSFVALGKEWTGEIKGFNLEDLEEARSTVERMAGATSSIDTALLDKLIKEKIGTDKRFSGKEGTRFDLMGNMSLFDVKSKAASDSKVALCYQLKETKDGQKKAAKVSKVPVLSPEECIAVAARVSEICDVLEAYEKDGTLSKLDESRKGLKDVSKKLNGELKKASKKDSFDSGIKSAAEGAIRFNTDFTNLTTGIQTKVSAQVVSACRASLVLASKSLSTYK